MDERRTEDRRADERAGGGQDGAGRVTSEREMSERDRQRAAETGRINPATGDGRGINPNDAGRGLPMTDHQRERLRVLSEEAAVPLEEDLTYDEAERRIDDLQVRAGHKPG